MLEARLSAAAVAGSASAPDATAPSTAGVGCLRSAAAVDALVRGAMVEKSLPNAGLMKAGCRNTAAPRKVLRPSGAPLGGRLAEPGGGGRLGKAAAAAAAAAVQAESSAG